MEAKNVIAFEYKKEDRIYRLEMPHEAPLGEAYEASANFLQEIVKLINEHSQKMTQKDPEEKTDESQEES